MLGYALRRLLIAIPIAIGAASVVFLILELAPGNPADAYVGDQPMPQEVRERIERIYGFDRSAPERYVRWLGALCVFGELGWSHSKNRPVTQAIIEALGPTLQLSILALGFSLLTSFLLGLASARYPNSWLDRLIATGSLSLYAMPSFWLALMAIWIFSDSLGWFPSSSMNSIDADQRSSFGWLLDRIHHLLLPALVLGLGSAGALIRFLRGGLLQALGEPFSRAARARGLDEASVLWVHALRNALLPTINLIGLSVPALLSGALLIEYIFSLPGMGRLTYDAILARDYPVVLATTWFAAVLVVLGNLASDLAMAGADPRIRLEDGRSE